MLLIVTVVNILLTLLIKIQLFLVNVSSIEYDNMSRQNF